MTRFVLALVVRLLPDREWGRAMLAELAALDDPGTRRRFAVGCARAVLSSGAFAGRIGGYALVAAALALLVSPSGGNLGMAGMVLFGFLWFEGVSAIARKPAIVGATALTGATVWWGGLLFSETVREHPQWALLVVALATLAGALRGGPFAAAGTAFATCLAIFVVAVGTYAVRPALAPNVAPANATRPLLDNRIESTDPYVGELFLAGLVGLALTGAGVAAAARDLPG